MKIIRQSCPLNIQTAKYIPFTFGFTTLFSQQITLHSTIYSIVFNPQHQWCLPTAPHVLSTNTTIEKQRNDNKAALTKNRNHINELGLIGSKQTYKP